MCVKPYSVYGMPSEICNETSTEFRDCHKTAKAAKLFSLEAFHVYNSLEFHEW